MTRIISLLLFFLITAQTANAEGVVFAPEVQCDFEVKESYFLLAYDSGRLEIIPTVTTPVKGRGDKALVGGATVIIGGTLPISDDSVGAPEQLTTIRAILRGSESLLKVVPLKPPIAEDLHTLDKTKLETAALIKSKLNELERAEGQIVQAEAALERMRSQVDDSSESEQSSSSEDQTTGHEQALDKLQRSIQFLERRYRKLLDNAEYPHANVIQASYEEASRSFHKYSSSKGNKTDYNRDSSSLSVEDKQRLIQLGRTFDPDILRDRLDLLRSKTKAFESRLTSLGVSLEEDSSSEKNETELESSMIDGMEEGNVPVEITTDE